MQILAELTRQPAASAVGLDMCEQGLCWVELRQSQIGLVLVRCHFEPLSPGCILDGQIAEFKEVEAALGRLLHAAGAGKNPSVKQALSLGLAVPTRLVTVHRKRYPGQPSEVELVELVQADLASELRRPAAHLSVDFLASSAQSFAQQSGTEVFAAAVSKDAVEDRMALIEGAGPGLRPVVMAMASQMAVLAACRAIRARSSRPGAAVALVQVQRDELQLDIVQQASILHSERFAWPANASVSGDASSESFFELPAELLDAMEAMQAAAVPNRPWQIWVSGPAAEAAALAGMLQRCTGLPSAVLDPFEAMLPAHALPRHGLPSEATALVACGLALTAMGGPSGWAEPGALPTNTFPACFNFLPHREIASAKRQKSLLLQFGAAALLVLLTSLVLREVLSEKLGAGQAAQTELRQEIEAVDTELQRVAAVVAEAQLLRRHEEVLTSFAREKAQTPEMLHELRVLLPEGLHLSSLYIDHQGHAILSGQARSSAEVFGLVGSLSAASRYFKQATLLDLSLPSDSGAPAAPQTAQTGISSTMLAPAAVPSVASPVSAGLAERVIFTVRAQP
jgi:Tfp pilus assembly PilM family ATPase/Tfp pilus assembly protein PilN